MSSILCIAAVAANLSPWAEVIWTRPICVETNRYIGWPTVCQTQSGELLAVFSGDRDGHICPYGKVQLVRSSDEGETWSQPVTIRNSSMDDRDAGIVELKDGTLLVNSFSSFCFASQKKYRGIYEKIPEADAIRDTGYFTIRSTDGGKTWDSPVRTMSSAPHNFIQLRDGRILTVGRRWTSQGNFHEKDPQANILKHAILAEVSNDGGKTWQILSHIKPQAPYQATGMHEPHVVELKNGTLVCQIRYHGGRHRTLQCESKDGGKTWGDIHETGIYGFPSHLIGLQDGRILSTYASREVGSIGEYACVSADDGKTWSTPVMLSRDGNRDLGYPSTVQLKDGTLLTAYYQHPTPNSLACLMATKWRLKDGMKTPETSKLFVQYVDPESGVVSYMLKPGLISESQQSMYFNVKSMTDDGRFMVVVCRHNEYTGDGTGKRKAKGQISKCFNGLAVIDFLKDDFIRLEGQMNGFCTRLDNLNDKLYYVRKTDNPANDAICCRDLKGDPNREIEVCKIPYELHHGGKVAYYCTHITLNGARNQAFLESKLGPDDRYVQGVIDLRTGKYRKWGETDFWCNHGQFCPGDDSLALCAWECCWLGKGKEYLKKTGIYPRLWLLRSNGSKELVPARRSNRASHEIWDEDGKGFLFCGNGVWHHDLKTGNQEMFCPNLGAIHATTSADKQFVAFDEKGPRTKGTPWRGESYHALFWNRQTERSVALYGIRPALGGSTGRDNQSHHHPDPHPQFVCRDRYIVSTFNNLDGHMDFLVTPVQPLIDRTSAPAIPGKALTDWPVGKGPKTVAARIIDQFLVSNPLDFHPVGFAGHKGYGDGKVVHYPVVSLWVNAIESAWQLQDRRRLTELTKKFNDFLPGGKSHQFCSKFAHVDYSIFGSLPYEVFLATGDKRCLEMGKHYADGQWTPPNEKSYKMFHSLPKEKQDELWAMGFTPQTRLWIDDMYMIIALQTQAYRATGDRKYLDRTAKEMCYYLDQLQLKDGPQAGLFYHAPDARFVWGRGDGWMAAGMATLLSYLPPDSEYRKPIMAGYLKMMTALRECQREDGRWNQLLDVKDDPRNWAESSCTAMFTYAFAMGVRHRWLKAAEYAPRVRKAYLALVDSLDQYANVPEVCIGTGKRDFQSWYFERPRVHGDPHGQAALLWICNVLNDERL